MIKMYGVPGWGSTISELMLTLADIPYQFGIVSLSYPFILEYAFIKKQKSGSKS